MRRRLFNFAAAMWLLCAATMVTWVWSQVAECLVWYAYPDGGTEKFGWYEGSLYYHTTNARYKQPGWHWMMRTVSDLDPNGVVPGYAGYGFFHRFRNNTIAIRVPLYVPLLCFGTIAVYLTLRRRPRKPGTCHACGYNLTGNTSGVCPECGTAIPANQQRIA